MSQQFEKDTYVVYGKVGVCRVVEQKMMTFGGTEPQEYYVLAPKNDSRSNIYVPCGNDVLMSRLRPLLTREEIDALLAGVGEDTMGWPEDKAERQATFRAVMSDGDRRQLLRLIRCLYEKKLEKTASGKHLSAPDEALLQEAIRLVEEEFSQSLGLTRKQVGDYIHNRIEQ